ncbi:MAG: ATP-dependent RecD-like DNA helicase [Chlamydiales bacterium]|nr:ATP-dependent RecD-like DNA helicase [Chlamydiales bacterium]
MDEIYGYIESIIFSNSEQGFTVARLKEPKKQDLTTIVGCLPALQPGETIRCKGSWKRHSKFGQQFEIVSFDLQAPSDVIGIQKYLESGMIKGIGPAYAERIVKKFGASTLQIIEESPKRLNEVEGLGEKRIENILVCWGQQKTIRNVMIFLRGHGVSPAYAHKIFKAYGEQSIDKVMQNPYALAKEIHGIGFKSADSIAKGVGVPQNAPQRIDAGIEHVLWELSGEGHVCMPESELVPAAGAILEVDPALITERLTTLVKNGYIIQENSHLWVKPLYLAEIGIAREIARLSQTPSPLRSVDLPKAIEWVQTQLRIDLAPEQREAVCSGLKEKLMIITGGPGTGKSTITKAILTITSKLTSRILLAAPTGRAAKRLAEITRHRASTIHSLLEMDFTQGGFKRGKDNQLECDLLIVDEASMIDTFLMHNLLKAVPSNARVILVGDVDQLPSVGPGNVLKDLIRSAFIPLIELKQIFRQAAGSTIVTNAHKINQGVFPEIYPKPNSDFLFFDIEEPEKILEEIVELVSTRLPRSHRFHRFDEIQVLAPMKKGVIGTENLNMVLQQALNPSPSPLIRMGKSFHVGDKVMQMRNNYQKEVYNGDIGRISAIDMTEQQVKVIFDEKSVMYEFSELDEIVLAYAASIHKYQGSECPCIVMPIHTCHFKLLNRNLLYTGITRGKRLVVLVGTKKALAIAVNNEEVKKRYTGLTEAVLRSM